MTTKQRAEPQPTRYRRGVRLSIRQLSEETGRARDTIAARLRDGEVQPDARGRFRLKDVLPHLYLGATADGEKDPNLLEPHVRLAHFKAEESKQRLMVEARQLIPVAEVESEMAGAFKLVAQTLETIPDLLERDCGLRPDQIEVVEKHLDKLRNSMADRLQAPAITEDTGNG